MGAARAGAGLAGVFSAAVGIGAVFGFTGCTGPRLAGVYKGAGVVVVAG